MKNLTVSGYQWEPQVWVTLLPTTIDIRGPLADLLLYVVHGLNMSYSLILPKEEQSGIILKSGDWTGMMGMLHRKEIDMSVTPLLMTEQRLDTVTFTTPVFIGSIKILVGRPTKAVAVFSVFSAFDSSVWALYIAYLFLVTSVTMLSRNILKDKPQPFGDEIWCFITRMLNQGVHNMATWISGQLVTVMWCLLVFILMNLYAGKMISLLTLAKPPDFIKNINDFLRYPDVQPILHRGSNEVDYFNSSETEPQVSIWNRIQRDPHNSMVHGNDLYSMASMDRIEQFQTAVFQEWRVFKSALTTRLNERGSCNFRITTPYRNIPVGVGFRKDIDLSFLEDVNLRIMFMHQGNLIDYIYPPKTAKYILCVTEDSSNSEIFALRPSDVIGGLYVWFCGMIAAITVLTKESLVNRISARKCFFWNKSHLIVKNRNEF